MTLTCPKCASEMRQYERNRVLVDQCTGCGGLFLDRGELEKLTAAENEWHSRSEPTRHDDRRDDRRYDDRRDDRRYDDRRDDDRRYDDRRDDRRYDEPRYDSRGHRPHKKPKSFLSELFD